MKEMMANVFLFLCAVCIVIGVFLRITDKAKNETLPTNIVEVEQTLKTRDSIKIVVNNLDSIKDAKIIEVKSLSNDSTVKLFYQLIGEE